jgi:hypothetical protein
MIDLIYDAKCYVYIVIVTALIYLWVFSAMLIR